MKEQLVFVVGADAVHRGALARRIARGTDVRAVAMGHNAPLVRLARSAGPSAVVIDGGDTRAAVRLAEELHAQPETREVPVVLLSDHHGESATGLAAILPSTVRPSALDAALRALFAAESPAL